MLSEIYLIRHGAAQRDSGVAYDTAPGPGLTDVGRHEARQAAAFLSGRGVRHLYISPFQRTRETAEEIAELLGLAVSVRGLMTEARRDERLEDLRARVLAFRDTVEGCELPAVGVVSHASPLLLLRAALTGAPLDLPASPGGEPPWPTAGIWRAARGAAGWEVSLAFVPDARGWQAQTVVL